MGIRKPQTRELVCAIRQCSSRASSRAQSEDLEGPPILASHQPEEPHLDADAVYLRTRNALHNNSLSLSYVR